MSVVEQDRTVSVSDLPDHMIRRIEITASCRDCDDVPKVADAGRVVSENGQRYQIMHNGLRVEADNYCGAWLTELVRRLRGHHEPQEERVFHELLEYCRPGSTMVELGAGWSFYSLWYAHRIADARLVCVEPDPRNLQVGQSNFRANGYQAEYVRASVGRRMHPGRKFLCESGARLVTPEICVDGLLESERIEQVELLLADVQGAELAMLQGAERAITTGRLRFVLVATHHHTISGDPLMHQKCLAWIKHHGGHVLAAFSVYEGFSGDGFIAVSFRPEDAALPAIPISRNYPSNGIFRELEYDLADTRRKLNRYEWWLNALRRYWRG